MAYHRYRGVNTRLVRIFNTYGPRLQANDGRVISNFLRQALNGEDLTIYGEGTQTRSFCYVSDQIEGQIRLMHSDEHMPVNIGNPVEFTILECAREVLAATGSESKLVFRPLPEDDPKQRRPDISKASRSLDGNRRFNSQKACASPFPGSGRTSARMPTPMETKESHLIRFRRIPVEAPIQMRCASIPR